MDNHLHVLVRLDPDAANGWTKEEVVRRWIRAYPPKTLQGEEIEINQAWIDHQLKDHLLLLDYTSRLRRTGKARVSRQVSCILDRLGTSAEVWGFRLQRLLSQDRFLGRYFATHRPRLRELASRRGVHHVDNLGACPAA